MNALCLVKINSTFCIINSKINYKDNNYIQYLLNVLSICKYSYILTLYQPEETVKVVI